MTRGQREKLSEIMGYLWAKSDDALCAGYAEEIGNMLAEDEREHWLPEPKEVFCSDLVRGEYAIKEENAGEP
mgnify:FL=1